jgi:tetratricopeptide (TPR) repeat protein
MSGKVWMLKQSFNPSRVIGLWLAFGLALCALSGAGNPMAIKSVSAQAQDQNRVAAQSKFDEGEALRKQGTAESLRSALKKYEEALPLWRTVNDRAKEAETLYNIGDVYYSLGENQKALDFYNQSLLQLYRAGGDRAVEAQTLHNIGLVYISLSENQKALGYFNQALPLYRAAGDSRGEAQTLTNIGKVYNSLGEKRKALDFHKRAAEVSARGRRP